MSYPGLLTVNIVVLLVMVRQLTVLIPVNQGPVVMFDVITMIRTATQCRTWIYSELLERVRHLLCLVKVTLLVNLGVAFKVVFVAPLLELITQISIPWALCVRLLKHGRRVLVVHHHGLCKLHTAALGFAPNGFFLVWCKPILFVVFGIRFKTPFVISIRVITSSNNRRDVPEAGMKVTQLPCR